MKNEKDNNGGNEAEMEQLLHDKAKEAWNNSDVDQFMEKDQFPLSMGLLTLHLSSMRLRVPGDDLHILALSFLTARRALLAAVRIMIQRGYSEEEVCRIFLCMIPVGPELKRFAQTLNPSGSWSSPSSESTEGTASSPSHTVLMRALGRLKRPDGTDNEEEVL